MTLPRKLAAIARTHGGKYHSIAKSLGVNVYHVYRLMRHGEEPKNPNIRAKLFLPRTPRRKRQPRTNAEPVPHYVTWWRSLPKDVRHNIVRQAWIQLCGSNPPR